MLLCNFSKMRDVKVVHEECITQHKLLICVLDFKREVGEVQSEIYEKMQGMEIEGC